MEKKKKQEKQRARPKRNISGILLLDKPLGVSSNNILQKVKYLFQAKKAGHTGTLDPLATGMLPICFGEATKFSRYMLAANKRYLFTACLGVTTTTGDQEGEVVAKHSVPPISKSEFIALCETFKGESMQLPPMYSAIKHEGKRLYEYAKDNITVERSLRKIWIESMKVIDFSDGNFTAEVECSKGTYIRTLAEDIGASVGCGAYVTALRRLSVSPFESSKMVTFFDLEAAGVSGLDHFLLPMETPLLFWPRVSLDLAQQTCLQHGQALEVIGIQEGFVRFYGSVDEFLGVGEVDASGKVISRRLVSQ
jgi:tRNA pseudouridine55 synthase